MDEHTASSPAELRREIERLRAENRRLRSLLGLDSPEPATAQPAPPPTPAWEPTLFRDPVVATNRAQVDGHSSPEAKIALFRSMFAGREDVYAARWENARSGKSGWSPVVLGGPANARRPDRAYPPLTDSIVEAHLTGRVHVGLYLLLRGRSSSSNTWSGSRRASNTPCEPPACSSDRVLQAITGRNGFSYRLSGRYRLHLATALAVGDDLEAIVTYDERMIDAARLIGLPTATPR